MSEYWKVIRQAIRAGLGFGPRREITAEARAERVVKRFGLELTEDDFADLGQRLGRITDAERAAWRDNPT